MAKAHPFHSIHSHGLIRVGAVHYNTEEEIDRLVEALGEIAGTRIVGAGRD